MPLGRVFTAVPLVAGLAAAGMYAMQRGAADDLAYTASVEMGAWIAARSQPSESTWQSVREDLDRAVAKSGDPISRELLGVLFAMRYDQPEYGQLASESFKATLVARPTSGYTWANLSEVLYQQGDSGPAFEASLRRAAEFGPHEPEVQRTVANLGLAVYDEVAPQTRASIDVLVRSGLRRNPPEMLQISARRGRLDVACRHAHGIDSGANKAWSQLCPSREATQ